MRHFSFLRTEQRFKIPDGEILRLYWASGSLLPRMTDHAVNDSWCCSRCQAVATAMCSRKSQTVRLS